MFSLNIKYIASMFNKNMFILFIWLFCNDRRKNTMHIPTPNTHVHTYTPYIMLLFSFIIPFKNIIYEKVYFIFFQKLSFSVSFPSLFPDLCPQPQSQTIYFLCFIPILWAKTCSHIPLTIPKGCNCLFY